MLIGPGYFKTPFVQLLSLKNIDRNKQILRHLHHNNEYGKHNNKFCTFSKIMNFFSKAKNYG